KRGEWERALESYNKSLAIKEELEDKQGILYTLNNIGVIYQNRGEWERALESYNKSLAISKELGDKQVLSNALGNIGNIYQNKGEWERALESYNKSLAISKELGDKQVLSNALGNIGNVYHNRGEWGQALEYYEKSLTISEELCDKQVISSVLNNIGVVYQNMGEWGQALEYYERSLTIAEELAYRQGISTALGNIGEINITNGDMDEAKINLEKSLTIAEELAPISTVGVLANLSELWRFDDRYDDAFTALEKALQIVIHVGAKPQEIDILEKLADTYISKYIADKEEENLHSAEKIYNNALELASSKMPLQEAIAIRGIGIVQAKKGDITASKKSFKNSIEILHRLGAIFELQKTTLEYARALYENNDFVEAEIAAKSAAFDTLRNDYREPLMKTYLLLGDIAMSRENQYGYYLDCLKQAEFNPKIYVKTCFFLIFRMKKMDKEVLLKFIESLKEINKDKSFDTFLDALNARIAGTEYDTAGLPSSLVQELKSFRV
ncbi:Photosystem I assembly protein Ycf3, partial [ANME-1 cluster archaeon GoMg2]|nr:Photosystem I assembly protein Ycf3 [ANME-1 cluster archaeon GoMg2]